MIFYTTEQLGPNRSKTPEGFLVCLATPIARTGLQTYGPGETPVDAGPEGYVKIEREPDDVFRPETMASFEGKPLVNDHPAQDVSPANYRELTCGTVMNVRRGEGVNEDLLLADLVVMDASMIEDVEAGKREVSCGYDAEYEQIGDGHARQHSIIGNHVALVESARCGPRCAIRDHAKRVKVHDEACCGACAAGEPEVVLDADVCPPGVRRRARPVHLHIHVNDTSWIDTV